MKISARTVVYPTLFAILLGIFVTLMNPTFTSQAAKLDLKSSPSPGLLRKHVDFLSSEKFRNLDSIESLNHAADYIKSSWELMGFKVEEQSYEVNGLIAKNLVATYLPEGVSPETERLIVGAHYDVCMDLPGADDNASGVAGLLELGRLLQENKPKLQRRIDLVAWTLEEPPFFATRWMGSFVHAKSLKEANVQVALALSLDMIGYFSDEPGSQNFPIAALELGYPTVGNFISLVGNTSSWLLTRKVKSAMSSSMDLPVFSVNAPESVQGIDYSDHRSYWRFGYPALMITDTSFNRNRNYHTPRDLPEFLNYEKMVEVVKGIYGVLVKWK